MRPILTVLLSVEHLCSLNILFNRVLKSVDLSNNSIPGEGCQQLRAAVGEKNITLQLEPQMSLDLQKTGIGAGGTKAIADSLPQS